jgi:hypothetical protein
MKKGGQAGQAKIFRKIRPANPPDRPGDDLLRRGQMPRCWHRAAGASAGSRNFAPHGLPPAGW